MATNPKSWRAGPVLLAIFLMGASCPASLTAQSRSSAATTQRTTTASDSQPAYRLPPGKLAQAVALDHIRTSLHFGGEIWEILVLLLFLTTGAAADLESWCRRVSRRTWLQCVLFSVIVPAILFVAAQAPLDAIGHAFSLRYGISIEAWPAWLLDMAKTLGVSVAVETPLLMLASGLMRWRWSRKRYWVWFATAMAPITVLGAFLLPQIIEPLFFDFTLLARTHPALAIELGRVTRRTGDEIPPERMFVMKASDKSNGLNAYVSGVGATKRIVLWDTTADRMPPDEILFTFAHECGHYVLRHIAKGLALGIVAIFLLAGLTASVASWLVRRFGAHWRVDALASLPGLVVLLLALSVLSSATEPIGAAISRRFEHEADIYGQEAIHGIVADSQKTAVAAFNQLGEAYLDDPNPNPFVVFWTYDHPSIQSRATFAAGYDPWKHGQSPRFFPR
jgi:STE24 endopeptidase